MPAWLLQDEAYAPRPDRETFIDGSTLALLAVLAKGRARGGRARAGGRTEPLVKVLAALAFLLLVALARNPAFLATAGTGLLVLLALQEGRAIAAVLRVSGAAALFTALILLPSAYWGSARSLVLITSKVLVSVAAVQLVAATTEWTSLSGAFKRLGAPDLFLLVFEAALKYISLLGALALAMLHALKLRSVGRNEGKAASLSGIVGTLFLKSREMAEELYGAMECRGFTGAYQVRDRFRPGLRDAALAAAIALLALAFYRLWA